MFSSNCYVISPPEIQKFITSKSYIMTILCGKYSTLAISPCENVNNQSQNNWYIIHFVITILFLPDVFLYRYIQLAR